MTRPPGAGSVPHRTPHRADSRSGGAATSSTVRALHLAGWITLLAAVIATLDRLGGTLAPLPDLSRPGDTLAWLDRTGALLAAFSLLRVVALVLAWYLLVTTVVGTAARLTRSRPLVRLADAVTLPRLRRFLHATIGAGALAVAVPIGATLTPAPAASAAPVAATAWASSFPGPAIAQHRANGSSLEGPLTTPTNPPGTPTPTSALGPYGPIPSLDPPVMRRIASGEPERHDATSSDPTLVTPPPAVPNTSTAPPTAADPPAPEMSATPVTDPPAPVAAAPSATAAADESAASPGAPPTVTRLGDETSPPPGEGASSETPSTTPARSDATASTSSPTADATDRWRIEPGDHLWHVAEVTLEERWGRSPTDAETTAYLQALIDENREVLLVPDNPDLVFAGQEFALPTVAQPN